MLLGDREKHIKATLDALAAPPSPFSSSLTLDLAERIVDALAAVPPEIDEEMVERANCAFWDYWDLFPHGGRAEGMRAALEAAFTPLAQPGQRETR